jgi:ketosteroid isomerase-like protein
MRMMRIASLSGALLSAVVVAYGSSAPTDDLKAMEMQYWQAWDKGPDAAAPLYAKDADLVFYDVEPVKYVGWNAYKAGVPSVMAKFERVTFAMNDDVKTTMRNGMAWTSATVQADGVLKGGAAVHVTIRHTAIWEKRGGSWQIVHEHASIPASLPTPAQ